MLGFRVESRDKLWAARAGRFSTPHGEVRTPAFMPVGTRATVRGQTIDTLKALDAQVLLANTYHLLLRPGVEVFRKFGGIHRFMDWDRTILTDSGGYQIFSLPHARKITEEGAWFKSPIDGREILLSPECSIDTQRAIGSDIMMVLDQCIPSTSNFTEAREAMDRTHRWARRSLEARGDSGQALFGIVQGACFAPLRRESAGFLTSLKLDGYAIGGLAVGETRAEREDQSELACSLLPEDRPRYLMGVGTPIDLLEGVRRGVDLFDCILPTSLAQRGDVFTSTGSVNLRRGVYRLSEEPLDSACDCPACARYSRAYLHHLVKSEEVLAWQLLGFHNLRFYQRLMTEIRTSLLAGSFDAYYRARRDTLVARDPEHPARPGRPSRRRGPRESLGDYRLEMRESKPELIQISTGKSSVLKSSAAVSDLPASLKSLICEGRDRELVIWDIGMAAAENAMRVVNHCEAFAAAGESHGPVHVISFESDLDAIRLALDHPHHFSHLKHPGPAGLLRDGEWRSSKISVRWTLSRDSDANSAAADFVLYGPFTVADGLFFGAAGAGIGAGIGVTAVGGDFGSPPGQS